MLAGPTTPCHTFTTKSFMPASAVVGTFGSDAMRFSDPRDFAFRRLTKRLGEVKLPKLGWVRLRWDKILCRRAAAA